jgi:hypothetical protein
MKKSIIFFLSLMFFVSWVYAANNYTWEYSSVDEGEVRWWGYSQYSTQLSNAMATWNNYGYTDFKPDNIITFQDLTIMDINSANSLYYWKYSYYWAMLVSDELRLNTNSNWMWKLNTYQRQNVITHELGHSLWLAHSYANNIMLWTWPIEIRTTLGTQDKSSYDTKWPK